MIPSISSVLDLDIRNRMAVASRVFHQKVRPAMSPVLRTARLLIVSAALAAPLASLTAQGESIDTAMIAKIREVGLNHSQVMDHMEWLADVYGPRLEGSPATEKAGQWAMQTLRSWGLSNVHEERFPFGKGWSLVHFYAEMVSPQEQPIIGMPRAWTPGTNGPVEADVVRPDIESEADFAKYHGALRGKIVLTQPARPVRMLTGPIMLEYTPKMIDEMMTPLPPGWKPPVRRPGPAQRFQAELLRFYQNEGVVALLDRGMNADTVTGGSDLSWFAQHTDGGTFMVQAGGPRDSTAGRGLPEITLAVEHYNRMVRILALGVAVRMRLDVDTKFYDEATPRGFNIVGDIPGTDPQLKNQIVMIGAHFDSWHGGTGATDNGAGDAAMMEAVRILEAVGAKPRRTIRIALWGGEEEGLLGSKAYATAHIGDAATGKVEPGYETFDAYYNLDNGTGKIRGIWMEDNAGVAPIFRAFLAPFRDLGVDLFSPRPVRSTDHETFEAFGLPSFQFVQDRLEYAARTHHTNMDVVDRVQPGDMKQMSTIVAAMAWLTAQRDGMLPRKRLPKATSPGAI
ncbi:MAG: M20/M25/M40 family metallo-hydrolase [Gemmatimonadaceae bacterium]|nr:M20/M25/M40 family metallo-hydrolase [Gemmatimonadaceae bacterium]